MIDTSTSVNENPEPWAKVGRSNVDHIGVGRLAVLAAPLKISDAAELGAGFSALADSVRLRVLSLLAAAPSEEVHLCDFVQPLGKTRPTVSHLHVRRRFGAGDRRGKWVWYSLDTLVWPLCAPPSASRCKQAKPRLGRTDSGKPTRLGVSTTA